MLKTVLFSFIMIFTASFATAADVVGDPVGEWEFTVTDIPDMDDATGTMTISKEGDSYTISFSSDAGDADLSDVKVDGNSISGALDIQGVVLKLSGTFDGDNFSGQFDSEFGAFPVTAERL